VRARSVLAILAVTAVLAGCSAAGDPEVQPAPAVDTAAPVAGATGAAAAAPTGGTENLKLKQVVKVPAGTGYPAFTVTALEYKRVTEYGNETDGVKVRFCADAKVNGDQPEVTDEPWSLLYNGGESTHEGTGYSEKLKPEYPSWVKPRKVAPGKCVTGWIPFSGIDGSPEAVQYSNDAVTASWKLR
jgi:hypothetical protein